MEDFLYERYELMVGRISQIPREQVVKENWQDYFVQIAEYMGRVFEYFTFVRGIDLKNADLQELQNRYTVLYEDLWGDRYKVSYTNPVYCTSCLGADYGLFAAMLFAELRDLPCFIIKGDLEEMVIRLELFVEVYSACAGEWQETGCLPDSDSLKRIFYWYVSDYADVTLEKRLVWEGPDEELLMGARLARMLETAEETRALPIRIHGILYNISSQSSQADYRLLPAEDSCQEQYFIDHSEDLKQIWDKALAKRIAEVSQTLAEKYGAMESN